MVYGALPALPHKSEMKCVILDEKDKEEQEMLGFMYANGVLFPVSHLIRNDLHSQR